MWMMLWSVAGHRFYVGRRKSGTLQCLTCGGCGVWSIYDGIMLISGEFKDQYGLKLKDWGQIGGLSGVWWFVGISVVTYVSHMFAAYMWLIYAMPHLQGLFQVIEKQHQGLLNQIDNLTN